MKTGIKRAREHDLDGNDLVDVNSPQTTISALPHDLLTLILNKATEGEKFSPVLGAVNRAFRRAFNSVLKHRYKISESDFNEQYHEINLLLLNKEEMLKALVSPSKMAVRIAGLISLIYLPFTLSSAFFLGREFNDIVFFWVSRQIAKITRSIGVEGNEIGELSRSFIPEEMEDEIMFQIREQILDKVNSITLLDQLIEPPAHPQFFKPSVVTRLPPTFLNIAPMANLYWQSVLSLDLSSLLLKELPKEIGQLKWVRQLNLTNNRLTAIPAECGKLDDLEVLDLSANLLRIFPAQICQLPSLIELRLADNQLTELPEDIADILVAVNDGGEVSPATIDEILATQKPWG